MYDALPRDYQDFLRLSDVELNWLARVPDEVSGDNIAVFGGCAINEAYAHSWKMDAEHHHLTGSVATVLSQAPRLARDAVREGQFDEARRHIGMAFGHYAVDATTIWHLTRDLTADQHRTGEAACARVVAKVLQHPGPLPLPVPKSLFDSAVQVSADTLDQQFAPVKAAQEGGSYAKDLDLIAAQVNRCAAFGLSVALYIWRYVATA